MTAAMIGASSSEIVYPGRVTASILICDDEPDVRDAMRRTLRGYAVTEVGTPREALDALKVGTFAALITDFSLESDQDGLDLLQTCRLQYPELIRFLVTGNRDITIVVRAVNEGAVHRYFSKPWDDNKLRNALEIMIRARTDLGGGDGGGSDPVDP